jgi:hypothetical protein
MRKLILVMMCGILNAVTPVVDAGSYAYYVEQIEQATHMIQLVQQEIETLGGIKTVTDDVKRQIYHVQDAFRNAINGYITASNSLADAITNTPDTVDKLFSIDRDSISTSPDQGGYFYQDTTAFLDDIYKATPVTEVVSHFLHIQDEQLRRSIQKDVTNLAWKRLFSDQDHFKTRQKSRVDRVKDLLEKIEKSDADGDPVSISQMQINTALLLAELVQTQTELLELQKQLAVAQGLTNYREVDFTETKTKIETLNDDDPHRKETTYKEKLAKEPQAGDALLRSISIDELYGF